jgi:hypothetical protein
VNSFTALPVHLPLISSGVGSPFGRAAENVPAIEKAFAFQKSAGGSWRCNATALQPVDFGLALGRR